MPDEQKLQAYQGASQNLSPRNLWGPQSGNSTHNGGGNFASGGFYQCPSSYNPHFKNGTKLGLHNVMRAIGEKWYVACGLMFLGMALVLGWLKFLQKCSFAAVWGSVLLNLGFLAGGLIYFATTLNNTAVTAIYGLSLAVFILFIFFARTRINLSARILSLAARCVQDNSGLLFATLLIKVVLLGFLMISAFMTSYTFLGGTRVSCPVVEDADGFRFRVLEYTATPYIQLCIQMFAFMWEMSMVNTLLIFIVGGTTAYWYFHRGDIHKPVLGNGGQGPVSYFTGLAFGKSSGTVAFGAFIITVAKMIKQALNRQRTSTNNWVILVLVCIIKACLYTLVDMIQTISEYSVILASITGYGFWKSAHAGHGVLFRNFYKAYIADGIARMVISFSIMILSAVFIVAFSGIFYVSISNGGVAPFTVDPRFAYTLLILLLPVIFPPIGLIVCVAYPQFFSLSIFCNCDVANNPTLYSCDEYSTALCAGVFFASLCSMMVGVFGKLIRYSVDGNLICYAIDRDNGIVTEGFQDLHNSCAQLPSVKKYELAQAVNGDVETQGVNVQYATAVANTGGYVNSTEYQKLPNKSNY